ncbi:regulation of nuclear pre-mRNA domain-containing protein 1B-like isoform X2 [Camellia sinensis]|uniref:regulation of nuclear pre-mRNA domain-containing protein 1B-like isoform X2 n=1 Tax=Camellia sinensis TaxID=4442 RepID=UPI0010361A6D|nr:regulation of nuclear pre-mRNA domain-containing protein 1B-like isoform X2 [Camellia sinensis]
MSPIVLPIYLPQINKYISIAFSHAFRDQPKSSFPSFRVPFGAITAISGGISYYYYFSSPNLVASCSEVCLLFYCVGRLLSQTMGSTFNPQILMEKLAKLNSSQQSIETLSHWCIFHMNKAKQVVETWDRQFHCSPREQRLAFLYLANDILQNSRRKGSEFVGEFWKFLPDALRDVIDNGDEFGRNAALRLDTEKLLNYWPNPRLHW